MRPRPEDRGELRFPIQPPCVSIFLASMRPRPDDRGERGASQGWCAEARRASMRPRPEDRGELTITVTLTGADSGFNAATARRPWRTAHPQRGSSHPLALQCGHGPKTVENVS